MTDQAPDLIILEPARVDVPAAELGEGPCWDAQSQSLLWVDIPAERVHRLSAAGVHSSWNVGRPAGAVVPRASGGLVVAAGSGFLSLDPLTGAVAELAAAPGQPGTRMNDGKCDRAGRFYAGTMAADESPGKGSFYRLDTDLSVTEIYTGIGISNGIGWSPDDRLMYYIDSLAYRVDVLDYDPATGQVGERRPFAILGSGDVMPDGLAVDSHGGVWVAIWGGGVIQRYDPAGRLTSVVRVPADNVTSCAFGGAELDQLIITTADGPGRSAGSLFSCAAGVRGLPAFPFRGLSERRRGNVRTTSVWLSAFAANRAWRVGHDIPMTDNVAAMAGGTGVLGNHAEPDEAGGGASAANPARAHGGPGAARGAEPAGAAAGTGEGPSQAPFGSWSSPISAAQVAGGQIRLAFPTVIGDLVWWQEDRPDEAGRTTIMRCGADGTPAMLLAAPWTARTRVHEYGGLSYLPVPSPVAMATLAGTGRSSAKADIPVVFANLDDQRLYLAGAKVAAGKAEPVPLTPDPTAPGSAMLPNGAEEPGKRVSGSGGALEPKALRYADFVLSPDRSEVWCVRERHQGGKVTRAIVAVPLDGSAASDAAAIRVLLTGFDFFAFPTPSPDGKWLAWICWNHPHMPWDGTELRVAQVANGTLGKSRLIKGSNRESVLAPLWRDNTSLYVATDWTGWWNIYQIGLRGEPPQALYPADEEFAGPLWELGARPFALLGDGRLAVRHGRGGARLGLLDPETSELTDLALPFTEFLDGVSADGNTIAGVGGAPLEANSVVRIDAPTGECAVLRTEIGDLPDRRYLPVPRPVELEGPYGRVVHALIYPPTNPELTGTEGELPPYIVWVHGGPTGHVTARLSLEKAYFTSRGIGIIDVNYGGSTGYGRLYRGRLNREWGVVDVADAKEAARSLANKGVADGARLGIRGGSAGGWTALAAVTTGAVHDPVFSAAVSYYGVSDLRGFNEHTHDFESRYLDGLIGPLPGFDTVYAERAPVGHVNANTCPVPLLQGLDDPVVPHEQSESIAADLAAHGIRHAYIAFEGESHGFRKADSMVVSLEAELSFYGQIMGFTPRNVPELKLT